jgi:hypothetical protein
MMMKIKTFFSMEELIYIHIPTLQSKIKNAKKHICIMKAKFAKRENVIEDKKNNNCK